MQQGASRSRDGAVHLQREYDQDFAASEVYREVLPDEHNATTEKIQGAPVPLGEERLFRIARDDTGRMKRAWSSARGGSGSK